VAALAYSTTNANLLKPSIKVTHSPRANFIPKNIEANQACIFINEAADIKLLCLGKVGMSQQFCLAYKNPPFSHCGMATHAKKFHPKTRTFYIPGGLCLVHVQQQK
jgi:hypothetical protein